jgi:hypothetical protein
MTAINPITNSTAELAAVAAADLQNQTPATANDSTTGGADDDEFGPAVHVTLTSSGQAVVTDSPGAASAGPAPTPDAASSSTAAPASSSAPSTQSSGGAAAPAKHAGGGGGGGVSTSTDSALTATIDEAKRKVAPQVGVVGANEVVDKQGNIDQIELAKLVAAQAAKSV